MPSNQELPGGAQTGSCSHLAAGGSHNADSPRIAPVHSIALYEPGIDLWLRLRNDLTTDAWSAKRMEVNASSTALELDLEQMQAAQLPICCWWCNSLMSAMCGCLAMAACSNGDAAPGRFR